MVRRHMHADTRHSASDSGGAPDRLYVPCGALREGGELHLLQLQITGASLIAIHQCQDIIGDDASVRERMLGKVLAEATKTIATVGQRRCTAALTRCGSVQTIICHDMWKRTFKSVRDSAFTQVIGHLRPLIRKLAVSSRNATQSRCTSLRGAQLHFSMKLFGNRLCT
eukprot:4299034-Amphidinium_carterae.1